ncbi:MAG: hypothetical protein AAGN82_20350 [Myxococcota bacterium]
MTRWLLAFAFTQAVEVGVYRRALGDSMRRPWLWALVPSAVTHPWVWFAFPLAPVGYRTMVVLAEAFAVGVEALLLRRWGVRRALAWSLVANGLSLGLGLASRHLFGLP